MLGNSSRSPGGGRKGKSITPHPFLVGGAGKSVLRITETRCAGDSAPGTWDYSRVFGSRAERGGTVPGKGIKRKRPLGAGVSKAERVKKGRKDKGGVPLPRWFVCEKIKRGSGGGGVFPDSEQTQQRGKKNRSSEEKKRRKMKKKRDASLIGSTTKSGATG